MVFYIASASNYERNKVCENWSRFDICADENLHTDPKTLQNKLTEIDTVEKLLRQFIIIVHYD